MSIEMKGFLGGTVKQTPNSKVPFVLLQAKVVKAPANAEEPVTVMAIHRESDSGRLTLGEAYWVRPDNKELPEIGDECLAAIDDTGRPWVVAWHEVGGTVTTGEPIVENLPSSPHEGETVLYQNAAMRGQGAYWRMRWLAPKWVCVGGTWHHQIAKCGHEQEPNESVVEITGSPEITIPYYGAYALDLRMMRFQLITAGAAAYVYTGPSSGENSVNWLAYVGGNTSFPGAGLVGDQVMSAGQKVKAWVWCSGTGKLLAEWVEIRIQPIWIGEEEESHVD